MTTPLTPISMSERLRTDYQWTPRQREVLSLMERGKNNLEIADTLGISRDGVKYHVSEILSKLGAESREEAAEYWRRYNGMAPRFARVFRAVVGGTAMKVAAGVAAVGAASAVAVVALLALNGDDAPVADPDVEPTAVATTVSTPGASPTPSASQTAANAPIPGLGVPAADLSTADPAPLPPGWTLFSWHLPCFACDGSLADFRRWTSDPRGASGDFLFSFTEPPEPGSQDVYTVAFGADANQIAAGLCTQGYCGGIAGPSEDAEAELYRSDDGGRTWRNLGVLPRGASLAGFIDGEVIVQQFHRDGSAFSTPRAEPLAPPGLAPDWVVTGSGREPVWVRYGRNATGDRNHLRSTYQDSRGPIVPPLPDTDAILHGLTGRDEYVWELHTLDAAGEGTTALAVADRAGTPLRVLRWEGRWWSIRAFSGAQYLVGYGDDPSLGPAPAPFIIDLRNGTLTPLSGLPRNEAETYTYPMAVVPGP